MVAGTLVTGAVVTGTVVGAVAVQAARPTAIRPATAAETTNDGRFGIRQLRRCSTDSPCPSLIGKLGRRGDTRRSPAATAALPPPARWWSRRWPGRWLRRGSGSPPPLSRHSSGTRHSRTATPTTQASPPDHTANCGPPMPAASPVSASPSRGPPATTAKKVPDSRPCRWSGTVRCWTAWRNTAEMTSAAPARASSARPIHSTGMTPKRAMVVPQTTTQAAMARPWWRTRLHHPVNSDPMSAPAPGAA